MAEAAISIGSARPRASLSLESASCDADQLVMSRNSGFGGDSTPLAEERMV